MKLNALAAAALAMFGGAAFAQQPLVVNVAAEGAQPPAGGLVVESQQLDLPASPDLQAFKQKMMAAHPDLDLVGIEGEVRAVMAPRPQPQPKTPVMAIFVKNNTKVAGMNDEVDGIRDRLAAELAGLNFVVMDSAEIGAAFFQSKIPAETQDQMIDQLFRGGSVTRVAQTLGADYVLLATVTGASQMNRFAGDRGVTIYTLRMTSKVLDATTGGSVYGRNWTNKRPVPQGNGDEPMNLYNDLIDMWVADTGADLAASSARWRDPVRDSGALASFTVTTTLDAYIQPLAATVDATRDVKDELRVVAGGITVEIDGAAVGSSGGVFKARPGLHQMRVTRQWMQPWVKTVNIQEGAVFNVALELSDEGFRHYSDKELLRSELAMRYAEAAYRRGCRVNFDTSAWQTVTWAPNPGATSVSSSTFVQPPVVDPSAQMVAPQTPVVAPQAPTAVPQVQ